MINHVWFDVAGTLYRETPAFDRVHDALRYKTYADIVGETDLDKAKRAYDELYSKYGSNSAVFSSLGKPSDFWQMAFDDMDLVSVITPNPVISSSLEQLSNLVPISLFTNFKPHKIASVLDLLKIPADIFTHVLSGDDIQKRKPDPEGFNKMIEISGLPAEQLLYVGDRVAVDIKPSKAVGMKTCLIWQTSPEADYCVKDYPELLSVVKQNRDETEWQ